jgi:hypothetical protein
MKNRQLARLRLPMAALIGLGLLAGCPFDDTFEYVSPIWCGAELCDWIVDEGDVRRGPTWHTEDPSLEMVSDRVRLSLRIEADPEMRCGGLSLMADTASATLFFEIDVGDDGTIEHNLLVQGERFQRQFYGVDNHLLPLPVPVRFILRKEGPSLARLADIRISCGPPPPSAP